MPGAWEETEPEVLVATLTRELVSTQWALGYANLMLRMPPSTGRVIKTGVPYDHGRNMACEDVLRHRFTWLFFVDDDVIPPADAFQRLAAHGKDIVSGLYYRRAEPIVPVAMVYDAAGNLGWVTSWPTPGQLLEVDLVGGGCLLIHRRVLERMTPPWFEWQIGREIPAAAGNDPNPAKRMSEDFAFCHKAKHDFGFPIYVDTSIVCEHIGLGKSSINGFRPGGY